MQLLCLADQDPADALPGVELLAHELRAAPLSIEPSPSLAARSDAVLIDGTQHPRLARSAGQALASSTATPVLLVIAESTLTAVTTEWGVDDVLLPTASPAEIDLRLRLACERAQRRGAGTAETGATGLRIDEETFTARLHDRPLDLTYKEFELLHFLAAHPGRVFTREQLLSDVWGTDYFGGTRTVDVHVRRLRAKLGEHDSLIGTVRGVGYGFARESQDTEDGE